MVLDLVLMVCRCVLGWMLVIRNLKMLYTKVSFRCLIRISTDNILGEIHQPQYGSMPMR